MARVRARSISDTQFLTPVASFVPLYAFGRDRFNVGEIGKPVVSEDRRVEVIKSPCALLGWNIFKLSFRLKSEEEQDWGKNGALSLFLCPSWDDSLCRSF